MLFYKNIKLIDYEEWAKDCPTLFNQTDKSDDEEDMLDKAWGLESESRLSCQVEITDTDLDVELPKYTINMVSENHYCSGQM